MDLLVKTPGNGLHGQCSTPTSLYNPHIEESIYDVVLGLGFESIRWNDFVLQILPNVTHYREKNRLYEHHGV